MIPSTTRRIFPPLMFGETTPVGRGAQQAFPIQTSRCLANASAAEAEPSLAVSSILDFGLHEPAENAHCDHPESPHECSYYCHPGPEGTDCVFRFTDDEC